MKLQQKIMREHPILGPRLAAQAAARQLAQEAQETRTAPAGEQA